MRLILALLILLAPPVALAELPAPNAALEGTHWRLAALNGEAVPRPPQGAREAHLILKGQGRYAATAGCNRMMGGYTLDGQALTFGPAAATLMACPEPLMSLESAFGQALGAVTTYAITGDAMALHGADGVVARFEAVYPP